MEKHAQLKRAVILCTLFLAMVPTAWPRTIRVATSGSGVFTTIQAAIDDANDGDTVLVAPGTYAGDGNRDIDFRGKAITVRSEAGPRTCIINCQGSRDEYYRGFVFTRGEDANSIVEGFTITKGYTREGGSGVFCERSSPCIKGCIIMGNRARNAGVGIKLIASDSTIENCIISGNYIVPPIWGGGGGAGISCSGVAGRNAYPAFRNCTIVGNRGTVSGAGILCGARGTARIENCIVVGNIVTGTPDPRGTQVSAGGCMTQVGCMDVEMKNCAVEDVPNAVFVEAWTVPYRSSPPVADYIKIDPQFADPGHWEPNDTPSVHDDFWVDGDYHLKSQAGRWDSNNQSWIIDDVTSPCIDAGDPNSPVGEEPQPNGGRINMGAYGGTVEASKSYVPHIIYVDASAAGANDGSSWADAYRYLQDALADAATARKPAEVRVAQGVYRPDRGAGIMPGDAGAVFRLSRGVSVRGGYAGLGAADPDAWEPEAYPTVLTGDLADNDCPITDPYRLDVSPSRDDNSACVVVVEQADAGMLIEGLTITGAYEWSKASSSPQRAGLSIGPGSDITVRHCTFMANAAHGLESRRCNLQIVDCTFRDNISSIEGPGRGGGACFSEGNVHVLRCVFDRNQARQGGAIYGEACLSIEDSVFSRNVALFLEADAGGQGGAIYSRWASCSKLLRCEFYENIAADGGAICIGWHGMGNVPYRVSATMRIEDCMFQGNWAGWGGALYVSREEYQFLRCRFSGNVAGVGGAVSNRTAGTHFAHCLFSGNKAWTSGACIYGSGMYTVVERRSGDVLMRDFDVTLTNCTLMGNRAPEGSAVACISWGSEDEDSLLISNCILDNGAGQIWNRDGCQTTIRFSNVRGGAGSVHDPCQSISWEQSNLDTDPLFVDAGYWDPNGTPEDASDDFWVDGDYHLKSQAGRWDPESQSWVVDDMTSPCIDAGDPNSPVGEEPEPNGGRINMGAYGGTAEASMSYLAGPGLR